MTNLDLTVDVIDLEKYGINGASEVVYNPSYELLFEEETKSNLQGFEKGQVSEMGAVNVMTGVFTGRSPKDKWIVEDDITKNTIWWNSDKATNDNKPITQETWSALKANTVAQSDRQHGASIFMNATPGGTAASCRC